MIEKRNAGKPETIAPVVVLEHVAGGVRIGGAAYVSPWPQLSCSCESLDPTYDLRNVVPLNVILLDCHARIRLQAVKRSRRCDPVYRYWCCREHALLTK